MKTLMILRGDGGRFEVAENGRITRPGICVGSEDWLFLGFSTHHWHNRITITRVEAFANPELLETSRLYGWDVDHGTVRRWGSPSTARAWVEVSANV